MTKRRTKAQQIQDFQNAGRAGGPSWARPTSAARAGEVLGRQTTYPGHYAEHEPFTDFQIDRFWKYADGDGTRLWIVELRDPGSTVVEHLAVAADSEREAYDVAEAAMQSRAPGAYTRSGARRPRYKPTR